ncbi:MAG TPA: chaperonin GroEL [Rhabdochlamydiaceae bacterium]|nr:chaperonin GroEL [Rhabdochlamydiaceae bacterium]
MTNAKEFVFEEAARIKLREGIEKLADVVGVTLGPKGRFVGLSSSWGPPKITNDGNSIAKDVEYKDQYLNMGVSIGKEVAQKMKEKCGDGTTSTILLLRALVQNGVKNIASGSSPIEIKRGMEKAVDAILAQLDQLAIPVKEESAIATIATASASGNEEIGRFISEAFKKVGKSGVITIEEGKGTETILETVEGMQFDRGYTSAYFCTHAETLSVQMDEPLVLVTDKKISSIQELLPILQATSAAGRALLIIADDIEGDALSTLVVNKLRGTLKVCAVKAPGFGDRRKALLQDIAILTGATLVSEDTGTTLKDADNSYLGSAEKILITKEHTTIVNGKGTKEAIAQRIKQLENESKASTSSYDKEKLDERKAKLTGGVAVIRVGAPTEPAMKQNKQMFEDSLNSTRAAIEEGIVPGGGMALLRASRTVEKLKLSREEMIGAATVLKACEAPFKQLVANSGFDPSVYLEMVLSQKETFGFNVLSEQMEDLQKCGVMDPLKVVKNSLQFAASAAGVVLLSEALIGNAPEDEK